MQLFRQQQLEVADVALAECSFAVSEVIVPRADEYIVERQRPNLSQAIEEGGSPQTESLRVMPSNVFGVVQAHGGATLVRLLNLDERRKFGAGQDVLVNQMAATDVRGERS